MGGVKTVKHSTELVRNITIKLGYANAKVYQCPKCPRPDCYGSFKSSMEETPPCQNCGEKMVLKRHVSFVDCPGHDILMATMLTGAAVMDAALLLVAANESCPQPQTSEHLAAIEIMRLKHIIILQNKIDPTLCRADRLVGQVLGAVGTLPDIFVEIEINFFSAQAAAGR